MTNQSKSPWKLPVQDEIEILTSDNVIYRIFTDQVPISIIEDWIHPESTLKDISASKYGWLYSLGLEAFIEVFYEEIEKDLRMLSKDLPLNSNGCDTSRVFMKGKESPFHDKRYYKRQDTSPHMKGLKGVSMKSPQRKDGNLISFSMQDDDNFPSLTPQRTSTRSTPHVSPQVYRVANVDQETSSLSFPRVDEVLTLLKATSRRVAIPYTLIELLFKFLIDTVSLKTIMPESIDISKETNVSSFWSSLSLVKKNNSPRFQILPSLGSAIYVAFKMIPILLPIFESLDKVQIEILLEYTPLSSLFPFERGLLEPLLKRERRSIIPRTNVLLLDPETSLIQKKKNPSSRTKESHRQKLRDSFLRCFSINDVIAAIKVINELNEYDYEWFATFFVEQVSNTSVHDNLGLSDKITSTDRAVHLKERLNGSISGFGTQVSEPSLSDPLESMFYEKEIFFFKIFVKIKKWGIIYHLKAKLYTTLLSHMTIDIESIQFRLFLHVLKLKRIAKFLALVDILPNLYSNSPVKAPKTSLICRNDMSMLEVRDFIRIARDTNTLTVHIPWILEYIRVILLGQSQKIERYKRVVLMDFYTLHASESFNLTHERFNINRYFVSSLIEDLLSSVSYDFKDEKPEPYERNRTLYELFPKNMNLDDEIDLLDHSFIVLHFPHLNALNQMINKIKPKKSISPTKASQPRKKIVPTKLEDVGEESSEKKKMETVTKQCKKWFLLKSEEAYETYSFILKNTVNLVFQDAKILMEELNLKGKLTNKSLQAIRGRSLNKCKTYTRSLFEELAPRMKTVEKDLFLYYLAQDSEEALVSLLDNHLKVPLNE